MIKCELIQKFESENKISSTQMYHNDFINCVKVYKTASFRDGKRLPNFTGPIYF